ncbi:hypothetical protein ACFFRR_003467 [Megaselia abdita]
MEEKEVKVKIEVEDSEEEMNESVEQMEFTIKEEPALDYNSDSNSMSDGSSEESESSKISGSTSSKVNDAERPHKCSQCGKSYVHRYNLKRHEIRHTLQEDLECNICGEKFVEQTTYKKHIRTHKTDYKCNLCSRFYENKVELMGHQLKFHWEKFMCGFCTITYFSMESLQDHLKEEHPGQVIYESETSRCRMCNKDYHSKYHLLIHVERIHKMICAECHENFSTRSELIQHLYEQHHPEYVKKNDKEKPKDQHFYWGVSRTCRPKCHVCGHLFNNTTNLKKHFQRGIHPESELILQFKCLQCELVFNERHEANSHFRANHEEKEQNFKCDLCFKTFFGQGHLKQHKRLVHGLRAPRKTKVVFGKCLECNHLSASKVLLEKHFQRVHEGLKFNVEWKCKHCPEFFKTREILKEHLKVHEASVQREPPKNIFGKCLECPYLAGTNMNLTRHFFKKHPGLELNVEYKCKVCDEFFKTTSDMKTHMKVKHSSPEQNTPQKELTTKEGKPVFGKCNECNHLSGKKANLLRHFEKMHPGRELDVEWKCKYCDEFFNTLDEVTKHSEETHKFVYYDDEEASTSKDSITAPNQIPKKMLQKHKTKCKICNNHFSSHYAMRRHVETHSKDGLSSGNNEEDERFSNSEENYMTQDSLQNVKSIVVKKEDEGYTNIENSLQNVESFQDSLVKNNEVVIKRENEGYSNLEIDKNYTSDLSYQNFPSTSPFIPENSHNFRNSEIFVKKEVENTEIFVKKEIENEEIYQNYSQNPESFQNSYQNVNENFPKVYEDYSNVENPQSSIKNVESEAKEPHTRKRPPYFANARCNVCHQLFKTNFTLTRHFEKFHPNCELSVSYKCKDCDEFFPNTEDTRQHAKIAHQGYGESPNKAIYGRCKICKHICLNRANLVRHFKGVHRGLELDLEYKCRDCDEYFDSKVDVREHSYYEHDSDHNPEKKRKVGNILYGKCKICNFLLSTNDLSRHFETSHSGEELNVEYKCNNCPDFFQTTEDLNEHSKTAHKNPFKDRLRIIHAMCNICKVWYQSNLTLKRHFERNHPGLALNVEFKCKKCDKYFKILDDVREHLKTAHKDFKQNEDGNNIGDTDIILETNKDNEIIVKREEEDQEVSGEDSSNLVRFSVIEIEAKADVKMEVEESV